MSIKPTQAPKPKQEEKTPLTFRESRALLALRLMGLLLLFLCAYFFILLLSTALGRVLHLSDIVVINVFVFFTLGLIVAGIGMFVVLKWRGESYIVTPEGVIKYSGIIKKKQERFACHFVEGMTVDQGVMGRFFDYGNVMIYDPSQKQKIYLVNIPNPQKNGGLIIKIMKKEENGGDNSIPLMPTPEPETPPAV